MGSFLPATAERVPRLGAGERAGYSSMSKERTKDKLIVRWLPSKLTEEEFRLSVAKWQDSISWLRFEAGTVPEGGVGGQRPTPGCAYLQIRNPEVAVELSTALDGASAACLRLKVGAMRSALASPASPARPVRPMRWV